MTTSGALTRRYSKLLGHQLDYVLLDVSRSMISKIVSSLAAIDAYVDTVRGATFNSHFVLATFDDGPITIQRDEPIADALPLVSYRPFTSFGGTALYDAINSIGRELRDMDPDRASVLIVTDGEERDSRYTDATQARAIIDWMKAKGWQVTLFGCDFNNLKQAEALGLTSANAVGVQKQLLSEAARRTAEKRNRYGVTGEDMEFSDDERAQFGGYLMGPGR